MTCALAAPKWFASCLAMESVDNKVPYRSNATTVLSAMLIIEYCC